MIRPKKNSWILFVFLLLCIISAGVYANSPNYNYFIDVLKQERKGVDNQFRDVTLDERGVIFAAHRNGVYEYDGNTWNLIRLRGRSGANCLLTDDEGRIYVGSNGEIGYLKPNLEGEITYQSLNQTMPEDFTGFNEQIVKIRQFQNKIVFFSDFFIFLYDRTQKDIQVVSAMSMFYSILVLPNDIFVVDQSMGLMKLVDNKLQQVPGAENLVSFYMIPYNDESGVVYTPNRGIFLLSAKDNSLSEFAKGCELIHKYDIKNGIRLYNSQFAMASSDGGIIFCDSLGRYSYNVMKKNGLPDDIVYSLVQNQQGDIIAATNNGLAVIYNRFNQQTADKDSILRFSAMIREVQNQNNRSIIFAGTFLNPADSVAGKIQPQNQIKRFDYKDNSFQFRFASNQYHRVENIEYQYKLEGFDEGWSPWSSQTFCQYTNLEKGKYTLNVRAKNDNQLISQIAEYAFRINVPWYQSWWFFSVQVGFLLSFIGVSLYLYRIGFSEVISGKLITITVIMIISYFEILLEPIYEIFEFAMAIALFLVAVIVGLVIVPVEDFAYDLIDKYIKREEDDEEENNDNASEDNQLAAEEPLLVNKTSKKGVESLDEKTGKIHEQETQPIVENEMKTYNRKKASGKNKVTTVLLLLIVSLFTQTSCSESSIESPGGITSDPIVISHTQTSDSRTIALLLGNLLREKSYKVEIKEQKVEQIYEDIALGKTDIYADAVLPNRQKELFAMHEKRLEVAGQSVDVIRSGIAVPSYVFINSVTQLNYNAAEFDELIILSTEDEDVEVRLKDMLEFYGIDFSLVKVDKQRLTEQVEQMINQKKWFALYASQTSQILEKGEFKFLSDPAVRIASESYLILTRLGFMDDNSYVSGVLSKFSITYEQLKDYYLLMNENEFSEESVQIIIEENKEYFKPWFPDGL